MLLPAALLGLLLALGAFSAACTDDKKDDNNQPTATEAMDDGETPEATTSGDNPDLEAYFAEVEVLGQTVDADASEAFTILSTSQDLDELKAAYAQLPDAFSTFLDGMKDVDPPEEVADEHEAAISAGEDFLDELEASNDAAQEATTVDEFIAAADTPVLSQLNDTLSGTCDDLQAIADSHNIVADLGCDV
jgi:hypothetical protein